MRAVSVRGRSLAACEPVPAAETEETLQRLRSAAAVPDTSWRRRQMRQFRAACARISRRRRVTRGDGFCRGNTWAEFNMFYKLDQLAAARGVVDMQYLIDGIRPISASLYCVF